MKVKLTESNIKQMVYEAVKGVLNEFYWGGPNRNIMPATEKQLEYLKNLTGKDYHGMGLTVQQAAELIDSFLKRGPRYLQKKPMCKKQLQIITKYNQEIAQKCVNANLTYEVANKIIRMLTSIDNIKRNPSRRKENDEALIEKVMNGINKALDEYQYQQNQIANGICCKLEESLNKKIRQVVRESLISMGGMPYEAKEDDKEDNPKKKNKSKVYDKKHEGQSDIEARGEIEDFFEKPGVNTAPYAYELYDVKPEEGKDTNDMKNARSLFAKALHHEKNDNGSIYTLSSDQVNRLESMISSNGINEAVQKAINKILK